MGNNTGSNGISDLTQLNKQGAWLQNLLLAKPFGYREISGNWISIVGAFFCTRTMAPNKIKL